MNNTPDYSEEKAKLNKNNQPKFNYRQPEKKWGNKLSSSKAVEAGLEVIVGANIIKFVLPEALHYLKESAHHFRHSLKTISDSKKGGPEGMRSAIDLNDAIAVLEANQDYPPASKALNEFYAARNAYASELVSKYKSNETIIRVGQKLELQLKATFKNLSEVGIKVKPNFWTEYVDKPLIKLFGKTKQIIGSEEYQGLSNLELELKAEKISQNLLQFYQEVNLFYNSREKNENTIKNFNQYLKNTLDQAKTENINIKTQIQKHFPGILELVEQGYKVEDAIFLTHQKGSKITGEEISSTGRDVKTYSEEVDNLRSEIRQDIPMPKYSTFTWVDIATNPYLLALIPVIIVHGVRAVSLVGPLRIIDNEFTYLVNTLVRISGNIATNLYDYSIYNGKRLKNYLTKREAK